MKAKPAVRPGFKFICSHPAYFLAFGFGSGLSPIVPGTFGTLATFPLYLLLAWWLPQWAIAGVAVLLFVLGIYICHVTSKALGVADYGGIVWDEIAAFMLVLAFIPQSLDMWLLAFVLFRIFDIVKPFPAGYFDRHVKNGFGVMVDDIVAALYTWLTWKGLVWVAIIFY